MTPPLPFSTDGCSGGLSWLWRRAFAAAPPWEGVCVDHDRRDLLLEFSPRSAGRHAPAAGEGPGQPAQIFHNIHRKRGRSSGGRLASP